ncbi:hypothetical protein FRC12_016817 [Ceratobasidium sp. 428]|nr:hypothetical protein FRC12_016817 [Ceratobasidium sp. 428]
MMMADLDKLPHGPGWKVYEIQNKDGPERIKKSYLFTRDIVDVIKEIMANPAFREYMRYAPERHYRTKDGQNRVYGNAWTANWWWRTQERILDEFATIIPLIISADRTKLSTMSGGQEAYPVYITVANIDKALRRKTSSQATVLLAYLPVDEFQHAPNAETKERLKNQLTHQAMGIITEPLRTCEKGVEMLCADGRFRRGYPIVAGMVGDWPEQCMMGCVNQLACPRCVQPFHGRGSYPMRARPRTNVETLEALSRYFEDEDLGELEDLGLKPWWPWWANLPYVDFANTIMPDILHQIHQGMIKSHVVRWVRKLVGKSRVDDYYRTMPAVEGMRHFGRGISRLKGQWTGRESREVAKQLLPVAASQPPVNLDPDLTGLTRAILEFSYRAHASRMTNEDIDRMDKALADFHQYKNVIIREKIFQNDSRFDRISKLHALSHWSECIREMGTPDNYSTEGPEHLHIRCAKAGWRASNKVKPTKQMVTFMQRYEALRIHRAYMNRWLGIDGRRGRRKRSQVVYGEEVEGPLPKGQSAGSADSNSTGAGEDEGEGDAEAEEREHRERADEEAEGPQVELQRDGEAASEVNQHVVYLEPTQSIAVKAPARVQGIIMADKYGAKDFIPALHAYLNKTKPRENIPKFFFPTAHHYFPVWHRLYLHHKPHPFDPEHSQRDVIRAWPESAHLEEAFDVALMIHRLEEFGLHRYRAGRVRVIFSLPSEFSWLCPHPLAYVELFTEFSRVITPFVGLNTTSHFSSDGKRRVAIVPLTDLVAACHLAPQIRRLDRKISLKTMPDLLSVCGQFFFNHFYNHFIFGLVEHWRTAYEAARAALAA